MGFSLQDPVVQSYILYSAILALKLLLVSVLTGVIRIKKGLYVNPTGAVISKGKVVNDPDIERVRRAHLNDLENIPAFWLLAALYATTNPVAAWAKVLFRAYALGRILHTMVYAILVIPQPARALAHAVPYFINWYMGIQVILYYITAL